MLLTPLLQCCIVIVMQIEFNVVVVVVNVLGKPHVRLLWNVSRFYLTFLFIPPSHDCAQHQEANHDHKNCTLAKFF